MKLLASLIAVLMLFALGLLGAAGTVPGVLLGIVIPYLAVATLLAGMTWRVLKWSRAPVPFRIPTSCGQQRSLGWIEPARLDNPSGTLGVLGRMALEVLCFRSLLRNTAARRTPSDRLVYAWRPALWLGAMAFHGSMLVILLRHLGMVSAPIPGPVALLAQCDGFLAIGLPVVYLSSLAFVVALVYLLARRLSDPYLRYLSLAEDYFLVALLLGIGLSGLAIRHWLGADLVAVKQWALGLASLRPSLPGPVGPWLFGHLFLACVLAAYIPFSKVVHMAGVLMSPTRNLANNSRRVRHVNPWDYPVQVHTYQEYEDELRSKMQAAGIPVEKE